MDWGRLWAARGCLGTIFKKVQKSPQSSKKATDRLGVFFFARPLGFDRPSHRQVPDLRSNGSVVEAALMEPRAKAWPLESPHLDSPAIRPHPYCTEFGNGDFWRRGHAHST